MSMNTVKHPGEVLSQHCDLTVTELAKLLRVTRPGISAVLNGRRRISPEMALRLEGVFIAPLSALDWLILQAQYDLAQAQVRRLKQKGSGWGER